MHSCVRSPKTLNQPRTQKRYRQVAWQRRRWYRVTAITATSAPPDPSDVMPKCEGGTGARARLDSQRGSPRVPLSRLGRPSARATSSGPITSRGILPRPSPSASPLLTKVLSIPTDVNTTRVSIPDVHALRRTRAPAPLQGVLDTATAGWSSSSRCAVKVGRILQPGWTTHPQVHNLPLLRDNYSYGGCRESRGEATVA